jgi:hypothetical protein
MNQSNVLNYYNAICKDLKIETVNLRFTNVSKGGACIVHNSKGLITEIQIDLKRCNDVERGVLHEVAHKILIRKNNNFSHNTTFKNLEKKLIEKYFYSKFSNLLFN